MKRKSIKYSEVYFLVESGMTILQALRTVGISSGYFYQRLTKKQKKEISELRKCRLLKLMR